MHLDVKNCAEPHFPLLLCEIPGHHLGTNTYFSSPNLKSVSNEWFPRSCSLHQQSFWLLIFNRIEQCLLPVLCCHLFVLLMVVCCAAHLQQAFCLQKTFWASERLVQLTLHDLQRPAEVFHVLWWHFTEFNTQKWHTYRCAILRASISMTRFTNMSWHFKHLLHTEALQSHATASGDGGRTKVNVCLC